MNKCLRTRDRKYAKRYIPYLKLFLTGIYKCEKAKGCVWRGINKSATEMKYLEKLESGITSFRWFGFTSSSPKVNTIESFLGNEESCIISISNIKNGYNISKFNFLGEEEIIFPPSTALNIIAKLPSGKSTIIQLEESGKKLQLDYKYDDMIKLTGSESVNQYVDEVKDNNNIEIKEEEKSISDNKTTKQILEEVATEMGKDVSEVQK